MPVELLVRPKPYDDESHRGYMWRLAVCNGMQSPPALQKRFDVRNLTEPDFFDKLHFKNLSHESYTYLTSLEPRCGSRFIIQTGFRFCVLCCIEKLYYREAWEYAFLPCCLEHQILLRDINAIELLWNDSYISCIEPETHCQIADRAHSLIDYLFGRLGFKESGQENGFSHLDVLTIDELHEFILLIGSYFYKSNISKPRKSPIKSSSKVAFAIMASAADVLSDWPKNLAKIFQTHELEDDNRRSVKALIGYLHTAMRKELVGTHFEHIQKAIAKYIAKNWPDTIDKKSTWCIWLDEPDDSLYETGTELSKRIGASLETIVHWIERGDLVGKIRILASGQRQITVLKKQDVRIEKLQKVLTLKDVCSAFGTSKKIVRNLLESGIIQSSSKQKYCSWEIEPASITDFLDRCKKCSSAEDLTEPHRSLSHLMRFHSKKGMLVSDVFGAMFNSTLKYAWFPDSELKILNAIKISKQDFKDQFCKSDMLSIPEVATLLNVKQEVVYQLVNSGILNVVNTGKMGRRIPHDDLNHFNEKYVFVAVLAKSYKISPKKLVSIIKKSKLELKSGPSIDGGRQYLMCRDGIEKLKNILCINEFIQ